jgi:hypothetical protein
MNSERPQDRNEQPPELAATVDYIVHQYGLTREEARELVRQHGGDRSKIDAAAGWMRAQRRE